MQSVKFEETKVVILSFCQSYSLFETVVVANTCRKRKCRRKRETWNSYSLFETVVVANTCRKRKCRRKRETWNECMKSKRKQELIHSFYFSVQHDNPFFYREHVNIFLFYFAFLFKWETSLSLYKILLRPRWHLIHIANAT
jgi:uncharacterized protein YktA (UPF0223 family)